jgi:hypothetical protein
MPGPQEGSYSQIQSMIYCGIRNLLLVPTRKIERRITSVVKITAFIRSP